MNEIKKLEQSILQIGSTASNSDLELIHQVMLLLDQGKIRVAEKIDSQWKTNAWIKTAILLFLKHSQVKISEAGSLNFLDKIPVKKWKLEDRVRVVPPAVARFGSFIEAGAILMPSYINIGARVGAGAMIDTWATVGSCAQVGANVHISGGVGIGGVLEPAQAQPVIIEDNAFIGSRCIIVEGVHIAAGAVLGAGVTLTASTPIIDVSGAQEVIHKSYVPENSVVIPGVRNKKFAAGEYGLPCALIIGQRSAQTDQKTSLNAALRDFQVSI